MKKLFLSALAVLLIFSSLGVTEAARGDFSPNVSGVTKASHPYGFSFSTFNRFTNNDEWAYLAYQDNNASYMDERDFVVARKEGAGNKYFHNLSSSFGNNDEVKLLMLVHNAAEQTDANTYKARNTTLTIDWSNPQKVKAILNSNDANPTPFTDIVDISLPAGKTFAFRPYGAGVKVKGYKSGEEYRGVTKTATSATVNLGTINGSYGGAKIIYAYLKVVDAEPPKIEIVKTDLNPADQDGVQRNDTQTINEGETAEFEITVTNTGGEALKNVVISDPEAPICNQTAAQTQSLYSGSTFAPGDSFTYPCSLDNVDTNTFADGDNDIAVTAVGAVSGLPADSENPTTVIVLPEPGIAGISLLKWAANPNDKDGVVTGGDSQNDSQTVESVDPNDQAVFRILVENTGEIDLENVQVNDNRAPACALTSVQVREILNTGNSSKATISNVELSDGSSLNDILEVGESFRYDCTQDNTRDGYTNQAVTIGEPVDDSANVSSDDTTEVLVCNAADCPDPNPGPEIKIDKIDVNPEDQDGELRNDTQTITVGDTVVFEITVTSTGDEPLKEVVVTDPESPDCALSASETKPLYPGDFFERGESFTYTCTRDNTTASSFADGDNDAFVDALGKDSDFPASAEDSSLVVFLVIPPVCGNNVVEPPEQCDDGNLINDDGCSDKCEIEPGFCGDGVVQPWLGETCDDGNTDNDDGCSASCELEPSCVADPTFTPSPVAPGQNSVFAWETVNTGTQVTLECSGSAGFSLAPRAVDASGDFSVAVPPSAADGSQVRCKITEDGTNLCNAVLPVEIAPFCGDGIVQEELGEECDDGPLNGTDGHTCSAECLIVPLPPGIELLKWANNANDKDGVTTGDNDANDTQTVESIPDNNLDKAFFRILVENVGGVDLENVRVEDAKAPECGLTVEEVNEILMTGTSSKVTINNVTFLGSTVRSDNILQVGEKFRYDCNQINVRDGYTNRARTVGEPTDSQPPVNASDTSVVVVCNGDVCPPGPDPSIEIVKDDAGMAVNGEDSLDRLLSPDYDLDPGNDSQLIPVGATAVFDIRVTNNGDEALEAVVITDSEAPNCAKTAVETKVLYPGDLFDPGETFAYFCTKPDADPGDFDGTNPEGSVDGHNDIRVDSVGVESGISADDDDPSEVLFIPACTTGQGEISIDKDDSTPGQADVDGDDRQVVSDGGTAEFAISVRNVGPSALADVRVEDALSPNCAKTQAEFLALLGAVGNNDDLLDPGEVVTYTCSQDNVTADFTNSARVTALNTVIPCFVEDTDTTEVVVNGLPPFCGNGVVEPPEQCDDGNDVNGDGCSKLCKNEGGGGGGCSGDTCAPVVGVCTVLGNGAPACRGRKPVEDVSDPLWQAYRACEKDEYDLIPPGYENFALPMSVVADYTGRAEACVTVWANYQGLLNCGPEIAGRTDPFGDLDTAPVDSQCGITTVCPDCLNPCEKSNSCPGCFGANTQIEKLITSSDTIAKGQDVTYEVTVDIDGFDTSLFEIVDAKIRVHDIVVPSESGNIWDRKGIEDGDDQATWKWCDQSPLPLGCPEQGEFFYLNMGTETIDGSSTVTYLEDLNASGSTQLKVHYDMDSDVASTHDAAAIKNVAFAMVEYTYVDKATYSLFDTKTIGIGGADVCAPTPTLQQLALSSLGDTAEVKIIRPFVKARAGNAGYFGGSSTDKAFADQESLDTWDPGLLLPSDFNYGLTLTDNATVYTPTNPAGPQGTADDFAKFQEQQDAFYDNLEKATDGSVNDPVPGTSLNLDQVGGTNVFQVNGDLDVANLAGLNQSATFIVNNGNVVVGSNFKITNPNVFAAFIIRDADKHLLIDESVTEMDGLYLVEQGGIKSSPSGVIAKNQLKVSGNLFGDLSDLLAYRRYIGTPSNIEPSIEINFDLRLLDNTPPMLERFLGDGWREEVQG